jgi:hypothetical protein
MVWQGLKLCICIGITPKVCTSVCENGIRVVRKGDSGIVVLTLVAIICGGINIDGEVWLRHMLMG